MSNRRLWWVIAASLVLGSASGEAHAATGDLASYEKLDTAAGWVEFLTGAPSTTDAVKAQRALAYALSRDPKTNVKLGAMTSIECRGGTMTQSELIDHIRTVGSKWKWFCEKGAFTYTVANPTTETLFVRGFAHGLAIDVIVAPGKTATGTLTMATPCDTDARQGIHKFAPGRVTFACAPNLRLQSAGIVKDELGNYPDILRTQDAEKLKRFLGEFPNSFLTGFVKERLALVERTALDNLKKQLKTSTALGAAPAKLVDPRPYTLTIENPTDQSLIVTLKHEASDGQDVPVPAKSKASVALNTAPSAQPAFTIVKVTLAGP